MYVVSNSMVPAFSKGDMLLKASPGLVEPGPGDVIAFRAPWLNNEIVTHRLVRISETEMVTKGDNNALSDPIGHPDEIVGVIVGKIPYLGWAINPLFLRILSGTAFSLLLIEFVLKVKKSKDAQRKMLDSNKLKVVKNLRKFKD